MTELIGRKLSNRSRKDGIGYERLDAFYSSIFSLEYKFYNGLGNFSSVYAEGRISLWGKVESSRIEVQAKGLSGKVTLPIIITKMLN